MGYNNFEGGVMLTTNLQVNLVVQYLILHDLFTTNWHRSM